MRLSIGNRPLFCLTGVGRVTSMRRSYQGLVVGRSVQTQSRLGFENSVPAPRLGGN